VCETLESSLFMDMTLLRIDRSTLAVRLPLRVGLALLICLAIAAADVFADQPLTVPVSGLTEARSLDLVAEEGTIHALLAGRFGTLDGVAYLRSPDGGKTWTEPRRLDHNGDPPVLSRRGNDARLAVHGRRMVAVWQARGELPGTGPLIVAASDDGGETWQRGRNPAVGDPLKNQSYPALAVGGDGGFHLAWLDDREENGNTQGLRYARSPDGIQWSTEETLDPNVCTCCWIRISALRDRSLAVLYRDADPRDMRLLRSSPGGSWLDLGPVAISGWTFTGCPHCGGGLVATESEEGAVLHSVAWTGKENSPGLYYARSRDLGQHWSPPFSLGDGLSRESDIAARSPSDLAIVFSRASAEGSAIHLVRSGDGGRHWSAPVALTPPDASADHPRVVSTPWGYRAFWTMARPGGGKVLAMAAPTT
jgi:hypothetical protein